MSCPNKNRHRPLLANQMTFPLPQRPSSCVREGEWNPRKRKKNLTPSANKRSNSCRYSVSRRRIWFGATTSVRLYCNLGTYKPKEPGTRTETNLIKLPILRMEHTLGIQKKEAAAAGSVPHPHRLPPTTPRLKTCTASSIRHGTRRIIACWKEQE
jgi:hypothetical protein